MKKRRWWKYTLLGVAFIVVVVFVVGFVYLPRRAFPKTKGKIMVDGLKAPVEIIRDSYGVPHCYACSGEDLFFAQGYVHAQDRFWQMEFNRRITAGRLSELFGEKTLDTDIYLRTMGLRHVAEEEYARLDAESKRYLDAYAAGVNAYIRDRKPSRLGLEFALLGLQGTELEIEEWKPVDSLAWDRVMGLNLGANMTEEPLPFYVIRMTGLGKLGDFFAPYREDMPFIVKDEELGLHLPRSAKTTSQVKRAPEERSQLVFPLFMGSSTCIGSNNWAISGDLTTTGKPILANDQHFGIQMPSVFYEIGLHTVDEEGEPADYSPDDFQVRGFSMPGYPGIIAGHNSRIAWGQTLSYTDVQDLYFERINPENPFQYEANGSWNSMELVYERIDIEGEKEPYVLIVRKTRHGPIVSELSGFSGLASYNVAVEKEFPENLAIMELSLKCTAHNPSQILRSVLSLNRAKNFQEFREALRYWDAPSINFVYADAEGNIGYQITGEVPIRVKGLGQAPVPGWTDDYEWTGFIPYEDLPVVLNPEKGYIVTANNFIISENYPYFLGLDFSYGYRARRIAEMIEGDEDGISVEDVKRMQADTFNQDAAEVVPYLEGLDLSKEVVSEYLKEREPKSEKERKKKEEEEKEIQKALEPARQSLLEWDKRMEMESPQAVLYSFFWLKLAEEAFADQYPDAIVEGGRSRLRNALFYLLKDPENPWWDDIRTPDVRETRDDILVRAFRKGYEAGVERLGKEYASWEWGDVHRAEFRNQTLGESGIKPIENIFNRGPVPTAGGTVQVNHAGWDVEEPFEVNHISAMRQIIDLSDVGKSLMVHPPGQSGHPRHTHYDDLIEPWRKIEYHSNLWTHAELDEHKTNRLELVPLR
jgi:penicillin amidase